MAKGTKERKRRITGVKNIQQITRAMEMVATQKLKRLQQRAEAARPFTFEPTPAVPNARIAGLRPWMRMGWYALDALLTEGAAEEE